MISAIAVNGPAVDVAAADRSHILAGTGLARAVACGAAGPSWSPIEGLAAAGFRKFTTDEALVGVPAGRSGLYRTHCFAPDTDITLQIPVVSGARLRVVLHFAEVFHDTPGTRVFDVYVNGNPQVRSLSLRGSQEQLGSGHFARSTGPFFCLGGGGGGRSQTCLPCMCVGTTLV